MEVRLHPGEVLWPLAAGAWRRVSGMVSCCPHPGPCTSGASAASSTLAGPARPCSGCAINWAGISPASSSAKSSGTINDDQCQELHPRLLQSGRCVAGVECRGLLASTLLGTAGQGWLGLGFGSSVPLKRVLAELHAPSVAGRRDGQREGGMRAVEGTSPGHPELGLGSAGSPCARTWL